ncbi:hypothetical protein [Celeribacter baekdonensis]|nr:hypothetical protein [Celeribacter baekdonensis]
MPRPLNAAHLTAIDLDPPHFIEAAAKAGFDGVGTAVVARDGHLPRLSAV